MNYRIALLVMSLYFSPTIDIAAQTSDLVLPDSQQVYAQIEIIKAQNDLLLEHNAEIVSTVKWAVGGVITLVTGAIVLFALIAGVNYFQYNRRFSEDKASMKAELEAQVLSQLEAAISKLSAQADANSKSLRETVDQKFDSYSEGFKSQVQQSTASIHGELHQIKLDMEIEKLQSYLKEENYLYDYALATASKALKLTHTAELGWLRQASILETIRKIVARLKEQNASIGPDKVKSLYSELERLDEYQEEAEEIKQIIRDARST